MKKEEYIENLKSFIVHFNDEIKHNGYGNAAFDREQAQKDIETFEAAIQALLQDEIKIEDEIKIGDEVENIGELCTGDKWVVTGRKENGMYRGFEANGDYHNEEAHNLRKTGRHFPLIVEVLNQMQKGV